MHGFLAVAKSCGPSSAAVVSKVKHQLGLRREVGHTGTLDPLASGLLVLGVGSATRFIRFLAPEKSYELQVTFGRKTTTGDEEGEVDETCEPPHNLSKRLIEVIGGFTGQIEQTAPIYSALKYQGRPLYAYAREGKKVPPKTRRVRIDTITILACDDKANATLRVACGPGVYMRSLAQDLGEALGSCAYMSKLTRISCHGIGLEQALTPSSDLDQSKLVPADSLLAHLPKITLSAVQAKRIRDGLELDLSCEKIVRLYDERHNFMGMGTASDTTLRALRLLPQQS